MSKKLLCLPFASASVLLAVPTFFGDRALDNHASMPHRAIQIKDLLAPSVATSQESA
jgi:hypothetical protein